MCYFRRLLLLIIFLLFRGFVFRRSFSFVLCLVLFLLAFSKIAVFFCCVVCLFFLYFVRPFMAFLVFFFVSLYLVRIVFRRRLVSRICLAMQLSRAHFNYDTIDLICVTRMLLFVNAGRFIKSNQFSFFGFVLRLYRT